MKAGSVQKEYLIDRNGVDRISEDMTSWLEKAGVKQQTAVQLRLMMEELLLSICEHFKETMKGTLILRKRFGIPIVRLRYRGEQFNPIHPTEDEMGELTGLLLANLGFAPEWSYRTGVNELTLRGPREELRSEFRMIGAVVLAGVFAFLPAILPDNVILVLQNYLMQPVADTFMHALNTFVGLMIFLSIVTGICSIGSISAFSRMGKYVLGRMTMLSFLGTGMAVIVLLPFFRFGTESSAGGTSQIKSLLDMVFSIIPSNPATPFAEGNMLQILFMAVLTGAGLLILGNAVQLVRDFMQQLTMLFMTVIGMVCRFLPLYIFASLVVLIWTSGPSVFLMLWKPIVLFTGCGLAFTMAMAVSVKQRQGVPIRVLFSKISKNMLTGLATASSSAVFGEMLSVNESKLGVDPALSRFSLPFANQLMGAITGQVMVAIIYYLAEQYQVSVNIGWLITDWIICSIVSMTLPPVSGGMLACTGILMSQLSIPSEGLAVASILCVILDFFMTGIRIGVNHMEIVHEADHLHMLDHEILRRPSVS